MCSISLQTLLAWIQANWAYIIAGASLFTAITPTPDPTSTWGKLYKVVDTIALNILHAKQTGVSPAAALQQVAQALEQQKK